MLQTIRSILVRLGCVICVDFPSLPYRIYVTLKIEDEQIIFLQYTADLEGK
jgi:hypothetical protein